MPLAELDEVEGLHREDVRVRAVGVAGEVRLPGDEPTPLDRRRRRVEVDGGEAALPLPGARLVRRGRGSGDLRPHAEAHSRLRVEEVGGEGVEVAEAGLRRAVTRRHARQGERGPDEPLPERLGVPEPERVRGLVRGLGHRRDVVVVEVERLGLREGVVRVGGRRRARPAAVRRRLLGARRGRRARDEEREAAGEGATRPRPRPRRGPGDRSHQTAARCERVSMPPEMFFALNPFWRRIRVA